MDDWARQSSSPSINNDVNPLTMDYPAQASNAINAQPNSRQGIAQVTRVRNGYVLSVQSLDHQAAPVHVYAQHKRIQQIALGDWVSVQYTDKGVIVEEYIQP